MAAIDNTEGPGVPLFQYRIGKRIRCDLDGELFEAYDTHLSRPVWVRQFLLNRFEEKNDGLAGREAHEQAAEELRQRIRKVASLQHSAFVRIHNVEEADGCLYVVTEAVLGKSPEATDGEARVMKYLFDVASALIEAHSLGLVHSDLKPENLVIDSSGNLRILNFSLAPGTPANIFGTESQIDPFDSLSYTAPERFSHPILESPSDLYALGVIWYQFLCGSLPFSGKSGLALVAAKLQQTSSDWAWPESVSASVRDILLKLTANDASARPTASQLRELCLPLIPAEMWSHSLSKDDLSKLKRDISGQLHNEQIANRLPQSQFAFNAKFVGYVMVLLALSGVALLMWQVAPRWPQLQALVKPYSAADELKQGVNDLTAYQIRPRADLLASAIQHFQTVLEREPQNADAVAYMSISHLSKYYSSTRDEIWFQKAKAGAQQAMLLAPHSAPSLLAQARIQQGHHQLDQAARSAELGLRQAPELLLMWHAKMSILLEARRHDEALKLGELGTSRFPEDRYLLDLMGGIYLDQRDYDNAKRVLEESIRRQPESQLAYSLLATTLYTQGRRDEALRVIQKGLLIGPHVNLYGTLGNIRFSEGDFEAAAKAYENAVSLNKGVAGSYLRWFEYAEALVQVPTKKIEARAAFQKALDLIELRIQRSPDDPILLSISAVIKARLDRPEDAHMQIRNVLRLRALTGECYFWIALTHQILGDRAEAKKALNESRLRNFDPERIANYPDLKSL